MIKGFPEKILLANQPQLNQFNLNQFKAMNYSISQLEENFFALATALIGQLNNSEHLTLNLSAESSQFTRFNQGKIRQTGLVSDGEITMILQFKEQEYFAEFPFTGHLESDYAIANHHLEDLRSEINQLPGNPYIVLPQDYGSSHSVYHGALLPHESVFAAILEPCAGLDIAGLYAGGVVIRANANSAGQRHWFATDTFSLDYSLFVETAHGQKAVKDIYAGSHWEQEVYNQQIDRSVTALQALQLPGMTIAPGQYRTYLAPAAAAELVSFLTGSVGESYLQQGNSALLKLSKGERHLSQKLTLEENFRRGSVPQFTQSGEIAPDQLTIIEQGRLINSLVSAKSGKEYEKISNGADVNELMRAPEMHGGNLPQAEVLAHLDRGLYLSNLHYLNWSDQPNGRITGMTRYACFWVENGQLVAPIENLRFDEVIYDALGDNLIDLTTEQESMPNTDTYGRRSLGGILVPGMLIDRFTFTL